MKNNRFFSRILIFLIRKVWQGDIGNRIKNKKHIICRFYPSCSEYAILALENTDLLKELECL